MSARITDLYAQMAEQGTEIGVTLIVGGTRLNGTACSPSRYFAWIKQQMHIWAVAGGGPMPVGKSAPPPSAAEIEKLKAGFETRLQETAEDDLDFPMLCLRNVEVQTGMPLTWSEHPYLLLNADHVQGIAMGSRTPTDEDE